MSRRARKRANRSAQNSDSALVEWHGISAIALSSGAQFSFLAPTSILSQRLGQTADMYAHFRVHKMKFRIHPSTTITGPCAMGVMGGIQDVNPSTLQAVMDLIPSAILATRATVPTDWVKVPKVDLTGPFPWYKTIVGTADATEEAPGVLVFAGTGSEQILFETRGVMEFKTGVNPANSPMDDAYRAYMREERARREAFLEKRRLEKVLSTRSLPAPVPDLNKVV